MDGIVLINKEKEFTSHDVVNIVKRITKSKVGHTGTLDPNATGVLPLLLGNATKISKYLINHDKEYEVVLQLGKRTTTADGEGEIIEELKVPEEIFQNNSKRQLKDSLDKNLSETNLKENCEKSFLELSLEQFIGKQKQVPPIYSAIKVNGKKLYDYARKGQTVKIEPREIEIYGIELLGLNRNLGQIQLKVQCSKGTYIRSLCEDIAKRLGTVGYMKELNRTKVGNFYIKDALTISQFEEKVNKNDLSNIISIEEIFKDKRIINLSQNNLKQYINGVILTISEDNYEPKEETVCRVYVDNEFIGLGTLKGNKLKRDLLTTT